MPVNRSSSGGSSNPSPPRHHNWRHALWRCLALTHQFLPRTCWRVHGCTRICTAEPTALLLVFMEHLAGEAPLRYSTRFPKPSCLQRLSSPSCSRTHAPRCVPPAHPPIAPDDPHTSCMPRRFFCLLSSSCFRSSACGHPRSCFAFSLVIVRLSPAQPCAHFDSRSLFQQATPARATACGATPPLRPASGGSLR